PGHLHARQGPLPMTRGLRLAGEMGDLQTYFYLGLLLTLLGSAVLVLVLIGVRQVVPLWREGGHPVIAALTALVLLSVVLFLVVFPENAWGTQQLPYTVWVVRLGERLKVLSNICTHMQCAVRFETQLNQFLCPCHGGLYAPDGTNVGGPPPKPLSEYEHRLDGSVLYVTNRLTEQL